MIITNAFSLNMVRGFPVTIDVKEITLSDVIAELFCNGIQSAVGHSDTAAVFTDVIGLLIPTNRCNVSLKVGDRVIVGQYIGPRLPEGTTTLPENAMIKWLLVEIK